MSLNLFVQYQVTMMIIIILTGSLVGGEHHFSTRAVWEVSRPPIGPESVSIPVSLRSALGGPLLQHEPGLILCLKALVICVAHNVQDLLAKHSFAWLSGHFPTLPVLSSG